MNLALIGAIFYHQLAPLLRRLADGADGDTLERTVNEVWQLCCRYPFVKGLILGYGLGHNTERKPGRWRKLEAADFGDETFVREVSNRFQSLSDNLKKLERPEEASQELTQQERRPVRYR